ncbi:MAG: glycosyltransferase [Anaerolineae bacterium]|nr:glycosyltransferase [Anaerolineae bacterium]
MKVLYHLTILPPVRPGCEAVSQQVAVLEQQHPGETVYLNPNRRSPIRAPRLAFGFHVLRQIRRTEAGVDLHHVFNPDPFPFPYLQFLRRPVVYSLTGGVRAGTRIPPRLARLGALTVADERSLRVLRHQGLGNVHLVRTGIDTARFTHTPLPLRAHVRLLAGSAPWTRTQFRSKGVDALLGAARLLPQLHLAFLWRGVLYGEMARRVQRAELGDRVRVHDAQVDVNGVLATVHAGVALAADPALLHPYPHSLIEALAAGKPVLVSREIPMADYVVQHGCGVVVDRLTAEAVAAAVERLVRDYADLERAARAVGARGFGEAQFLASCERAYRAALESVSAP